MIQMKIQMHVMYCSTESAMFVISVLMPIADTTLLVDKIVC